MKGMLSGLSLDHSLQGLARMYLSACESLALQTRQ